MRRAPFRAVIAALVALLGFALATQVRTASRSEAGLASARQEDLVRILDDLSARSQRLQSELADLEAVKARLTSGTDRRQAALDEARRRARTLAVLAGTSPATGPGIVLSVLDPQGTVRADVLLDAVEELRDAGAEAIQLGTVRVVASTYLVDGTSGGLTVDGQALQAPYRFLVVGDPRTLTAALDIPGGVVDTVARNDGASATVEQRSVVRITALRPASTPRYARPASTPAPRG
ncbi:MAG: hypothetical protein QOK42_2812 [Frankiaceae bacterium]|jgi:uncharacterized protein YlxW (UPF0749 family)|nr:hypothetical protein [Frankiaceae bacterium]MDX6275097.1 hypothetical protein [Frankiales bacterium]